MASSENLSEQRLELTKDGKTLTIPITSWGHPDVTYNGARIPSSRIWGMLGAALKDGRKASRSALMDEAARAEVYRLVDAGIIIWTLSPLPADKGLSGNVYVRRDRQRIRPLVDMFKIRIAKCEGPMTPDIVKEILDVCADIGLFPVGFADDRLYFSQDPEKVFSAFGSRDFTRIAIYCRRPGASAVTVRLSEG